MFVAMPYQQTRWDRIVQDFAKRRPKVRLGSMRARLGRGLGDTCWIAPTGQQVCGAGDPAAQVSQQVCISPSTPQNKPTNPQPGGGDGKPGTITMLGTGMFLWTPRAGNKRTFTFAWHSGTNDVYRLTSGGPCTPGPIPNCDYAVVDPTGYVSWMSTPPAQSEPPCTTSDPLQQTTALPGTSSQCYINPSNGQLVCGSGVLAYPAQTSTLPTYPASAGGGSGYVSTGATAAMPASSGGIMQDLANLPTWAKVGGGAAAAFLALKLFKKGR